MEHGSDQTIDYSGQSVLLCGLRGGQTHVFFRARSLRRSYESEHDADTAEDDRPHGGVVDSEGIRGRDRGKEKGQECHIGQNAH